MTSCIRRASEVDVTQGQLFVDCSASAVGANVNDQTPVFSPGQINLQMIRTFQPTFSAALIGHIEASIDDDELKRDATRVTRMTDTVEDWIESRLAGALNQAVWSKDENLRSWIRSCRLDFAHLALSKLDPNDGEKLGILGKVGETVPRAIENMTKLLSGGENRTVAHLSA